MPVDIPPEFRALAARGSSWPSWLAALPQLIRAVIAEWSLTPDGPTRSGQTAVVVPVSTAEGDSAVVKFGWPHPEAAHEHLALRAWAGHGAVRLLRADPRRSVLLLERADAERDLGTLPVIDACEVLASLYARIHLPAIPQLARLSALAAAWSEAFSRLRTDGRVPRRYIDQAASLARDFAADPAVDGTLLHTDLHFANVLAADREPWLAIDPKPLSGEPAFEVAPLIWNRWHEAVATGNIREALLARLYTVVDVAQLDEDRVRDWVIVRELVNAMGSSVEGDSAHTDVVTTAMTVIKAVQR